MKKSVTQPKNPKPIWNEAELRYQYSFGKKNCLTILGKKYICNFRAIKFLFFDHCIDRQVCRTDSGQCWHVGHVKCSGLHLDGSTQWSVWIFEFFFRLLVGPAAFSFYLGNRSSQDDWPMGLSKRPTAGTPSKVSITPLLNNIEHEKG